MRVHGLGSRVGGLGVSRLGRWVEGFRLEFKVQGSGFGVQNARFQARVEGFGFKDWGSGFRT